MTKRTLVRVALFCSLVGHSLPALAQQFAQDRSFSPQLFHPAVGPDEFFTLEPARPLEHLNFSLGLWLNYSRSEFAVSQVTTDAAGNKSVGNSLGQLVKDNLSGDLVFAIGLFNRLQLGVGIPVTLYQNGDKSIAFPNGDTYAATPPSGFALGDPWIDVKVRLFGRDKGLNVSLAGFITLPLSGADPNNYGGQSGTFSKVDPNTLMVTSSTSGVGVSGGLKALAGWESNRWRAGIMFGFQLRQNESHFFSTTVGNEMLYAAAFGYDVLDNRKITVIGEINGRTDVSGTKITNIDASPLEVDAGVKLRFARSFFGTIGVGTGLIRGLGSPEVRVFGGITYSPDRRDRDHDGVPDVDDLCPDVPEDRDGFKDEDGCPDPDNDGDGIPDARDKCPNDAEDFDGFQDDDGCPDADNDNDGIPDIRDACPLDKEDGKPPKPADGCPLDKTDSDEDGIPDNKDKCPLDPEDKDGFQDDDGCPDVDNDGDGIPDQFDKCPNEAEDMDGFQDDDGCPDPDNDNDGIPDVKDKCPNEPETVNGFQDEDGCPDKGPPLKVQIVGDEIVILEKVFFKTAKSIIEPRSYNLLDQVASVLKIHTEIKKVLIEGHTDSKGNAQKNIKLSQERAEAVKLYLERKGLPGSRLRAEGFGPNRPVADNKTERGREANRRVQFKIIDQEKKGPPTSP